MGVRKLCFVSQTLQLGGMERVMAGLVNYLAENKQDEIVLITLLKIERFYSIHSNVKVIEPPFNYKRSNRLLYSIRTALWLRSQIKLINPYSVTTFGEYWNTFSLISTYGLRTKKFISDRSNPKDKLKWHHELLRKYSYKTASGFIAQTTLAAEIIRNKTGLENLIVTGNPIRAFPINHGTREKIIVSVGRLIRLKQFDKLIDMFSKTENENWKLIILGDGPLKKRLENQIRNLDLSEKVILKGAVKNVDEYLLSSKIFAFTSFYEGFPNALAEGMMAGCACISFDCDAGPSDMIKNNFNGFLVELNDEKAYIEKLNLLMNNDSICKKFSSEATSSMTHYRLEDVCEAVYKFISN